MIKDLTSLYLFQMERVVRGKPAQSSSFTWTFFINNINITNFATIFNCDLFLRQLKPKPFYTTNTVKSASILNKCKYFK